MARQDATRSVLRAPRSIKSVHRSCRILRYLTDQPAGAALNDIAAHLDVHKSTALRLLTELERAALVQRTSHGRYGLGLANVAMAGSVLSHLEVLKVAEPFLRDLVKLTHQTANLTVRLEHEILNINHVLPSDMLPSFDWIGHRAPLHRGAAAKALLAHLRDDEIAAYLEETPNSVPDRSTFWDQMQQIRKLGFAVNRGEVDPTVYAVGAPIFNAEGRCCASISIAGYQEDFSEQRIREFSQLVIEAAQGISRRLGFSGRRAVGIA
ncbi:MAG TPA: IclR family transcriptional regulator [bacterium]|nr:IclR family transcriptional regulator [bacterium]